MRPQRSDFYDFGGHQRCFDDHVGIVYTTHQEYSNYIHDKDSMDYRSERKLSIWRKYRLRYMSSIIYDVPMTLPPDISQQLVYLKNDMERFMFKQAYRAVKMALDDKCKNEDYELPQDLIKELKNLKDMKRIYKDTRNTVLERLDEILWNACMQVDLRSVGGSIGDLMSEHNMYYIDECLKYHEKEKREREEDIKNLETDPESKRIKSRSKKGITYFVNRHEGLCSCLGFKYHGHCKHLG